jgi:hypothetical protein
LGEEEDHVSTRAGSGPGGRVPHWLHLWPIKQLGPAGGVARKGGCFWRRGAPPPCQEILPLRGAYCSRGYQEWVGAQHSVHLYKTHIRTKDFTWASHTVMKERQTQGGRCGTQGDMERWMRSNLYRRNIGFLCSLQWDIGRDSVSSLPGRLWGGWRWRQRWQRWWRW